VKGALLKQRYRKDLSKAALRKASAIVRYHFYISVSQCLIILCSEAVAGELVGT
jgi:hypothetical protein